VRNKFNRYLSSRIAPERFASLTGGYIPKNGWEVGLDLFVLQHHFSVYRSRQAPFQELHVSACAMSSQQACGPSPFEVLTPDILLYIIQQYLIPNDVVSIACVCRAARVVAIKDDCWLSFLSKCNFPANSKTTGAFELARECLQVNDGGISGVSRNLADRSLVSFLKRGDVDLTCGSVANRAMRAAAWLLAEKHWERREDACAPGHNVLRLIVVSWLDVSSGFHQLPTGMYTLSFHVLFDAGPGYSFVTSRHCRVDAQFERGDGTVRDTSDLYVDFSTMLMNEALLNRWLRIDFLDCEVLTGDAKLRLRLHHTDGTWKSGVRLARCDTVPSHVLRGQPRMQTRVMLTNPGEQYVLV
jgi:hypothetical protein